jgi:hypothetical protein
MESVQICYSLGSVQMHFPCSSSIKSLENPLRFFCRLFFPAIVLFFFVSLRLLASETTLQQHLDRHLDLSPQNPKHLSSQRLDSSANHSHVIRHLKSSTPRSLGFMDLTRHQTSEINTSIYAFIVLTRHQNLNPTPRSCLHSPDMSSKSEPNTSIHAFIVLTRHQNLSPTLLSMPS